MAKRTRTHPIVKRLRLRLRRIDKRLTLSKRQVFVGITIGLTTLLLLTQLVPEEYRYPMVGLLSLLAFGASAFGLRDDLKGIEWLTLLTLPTLYTAAIALFYFLLPVRWLTRVPVAILYAVGMYALLLTENIFSVASVRTIALLRAAHSVGFLITLVTYYLLIQTVLAFRIDAFFTAFIIGLISFVLALQSLWATRLESRLGRGEWYTALIIALVLTQISWVFAFWPVEANLLALLFTTGLYSMVGMGQQFLIRKLYRKTIIEFMAVSGIVFIIILFASKWRGFF